MKLKEEEVKEYVYNEIDTAITLLNDEPAERGYLAKGAALAIKMRSALYYEDYERAKEAAQAIMDLGQYELDADYTNPFTAQDKILKKLSRLSNILRI